MVTYLSFIPPVDDKVESELFVQSLFKRLQLARRAVVIARWWRRRAVKNDTIDIREKQFIL